MKTDDKSKLKISNATKDRVAACKAYVESNDKICFIFKRNIRNLLRKIKKKKSPGNNYFATCRN